MPCYSVNTVSLDFQAGNLALLQKAAAAVDLAVNDRGDRREVMDRQGRMVAILVNDKVTCSQANVALVNKLRVQYSREIVGHAALKLGWQKSIKAENKYLLTRGV